MGFDRNNSENWDMTNVIMFPMKKRIHAIQAQRALILLEEVLSDIKDEELRGDLVVQAHQIILDFIEKNDPTMEEVEDFCHSFSEDGPIITISFDPGNDN